MQDWSLQVQAAALKGRQEEMSGALTELLNALSEMKDAAESLSALWKGEAAEQFGQNCRELCQGAGAEGEGINRLLGALVSLEQIFEEGEREAAQEID